MRSEMGDIYEADLCRRAGQSRLQEQPNLLGDFSASFIGHLEIQYAIFFFYFLLWKHWIGKKISLESYAILAGWTLVVAFYCLIEVIRQPGVEMGWSCACPIILWSHSVAVSLGWSHQVPGQHVPRGRGRLETPFQKTFVKV